MRLIAHNLLQCNVRGVTNGYPLRIEADTIEVIPVDFDLETVKIMSKKMNIEALISAANDLSLPAPRPDDSESDEYYKAMHHLLFEVHVTNGNLVCPKSNRRFPIKDGIPNMLLHEDEI